MICNEKDVDHRARLKRGKARASAARELKRDQVTQIYKNGYDRPM